MILTLMPPGSAKASSTARTVTFVFVNCSLWWKKMYVDGLLIHRAMSILNVAWSKVGLEIEGLSSILLISI